MKNTIKFLAGLTVGLVAAASQLQAASFPTFPLNTGLDALTSSFIPLNFSGSGVTGINTTNAALTVVTYTSKSILVNNTTVLAEFYNSANAKLGIPVNGIVNPVTIAPAPGDVLAVVVTAPATNQTVRLRNGKVIVTRLPVPDPWTGQFPQRGDVIIVNGQGKIKADLTRSGDAAGVGFNNSWNYNRGGVSYKQGRVSVNFSFSFGAVQTPDEFINLDFFGGGSSLRIGNIINGNATFIGAGVVQLSNPARLIAGSDNQYIVTSASAAAPGAFLNF